MLFNPVKPVIGMFSVAANRQSVIRLALDALNEGLSGCTKTPVACQGQRTNEEAESFSKRVTIKKGSRSPGKCCARVVRE
jgi:hypothetical protein